LNFLKKIKAKICVFYTELIIYLIV